MPLQSELAYMFRHALVRDAAYQLQLPIERAALHAAAFAALQAGVACAPGPLAEELAEHARDGTPASAALAEQELVWLDHAATWASQHFAFAREAALLQRAIEVAGTADTGRLRLRIRLATCLSHLARFDEARAQLDTAEAAARRANDLPLLGLAVGGQGRLALLVEDLEAAQRLLVAALDLFKSLGDVPRQVSILNNLGLIAHASDQLDEAHRLYQRALSLDHGLETGSSAARLLGNLARVSHARGDSNQAEQEYREAMAAARAAADLDSEALALGNLALLLAEAGRFEEAEQGFQQALALHRKHGARAIEAAVLINMSIAREPRRQYVEAVADLRLAVELSIETATPTNQALARLNLVSNLLPLGRKAEAARELAMAETLVGAQSPQWLQQALQRTRAAVARGHV